MVDSTQSTKKALTPDEVNVLVQRLHEGGVINADISVRKLMDQGLKVPLAEDGWYIVGGSGYAIVCHT